VIATTKYLHQGILRGKYHCTVDLLFDWFGLVCFANKNKKIVSCHAANFNSVKQEVNSTVILPALVFPAYPLVYDQICYTIITSYWPPRLAYKY
jgi:hypothetical protein